MSARFAYRIPRQPPRQYYISILSRRRTRRRSENDAAGGNREIQRVEEEHDRWGEGRRTLDVHPPLAEVAVPFFFYEDPGAC
jgi:hypothetical protein